MDTRSAINLTLKILGRKGFEPTSFVAKSPLDGLKELLNHQPEVNTQNLLRELKRQSLVGISLKPNGVSFNLTPAGAHRLQNINITELAIPRPPVWDHKWRLIAFDVPLNYSANRLKFTKHLQQLDFYMLQRSIWLHPYPCFLELEQIAGFYNIWRYCSVMEVNGLDHKSTNKLMRHFFS